MKRMYGWLAAVIVVLLLSACNKEVQPADRMEEYVKLWNEQKFAAMYELLTAEAQESITKKDYVSRYEKVYKDLEIKNLAVTFTKPADEEKTKEAEVSYPFSAKMDSVAGEIAFDHKALLKKEEKADEENWYIDWDTTYIFPELEKDATIGLQTIEAKRGQIQDRNGQALAENGTVYEVGIVPINLGEQKGTIVEQAAGLLGISTESINKALDASWVQPEYFVPIKKLSLEEKELVAKLTALPGVRAQKVEGRVYPFKEAAAHLIGYVGSITAEELKERSGKGYGSHDLIGKRGLEQVLDERLKGKNGVKITINKEDGTQETLAEKAVEDGANVQLTIDAVLQRRLYEELAGEPGMAAALHPKTGETLGIVSSPSFDPNLLTLGATSDDWAALQNDPANPLLTRFKANYAPGSVIKPLTTAIAFKEGAIDEGTTIQVNGLKWQKDSSWGSYYVTRVTDPHTAVDWQKALLYSDNIFFAQAALALGKDKLTNGLKDFRFEADIPYVYPLEPSQIGSLNNDILLADTGYGQGEMEMNIVHLAASYTPFLNGGTLLTPTLLLEEERAKAWQNNVISAEMAQQINNMLERVVSDPSGTAHKAQIPGYPLAGKTGTAELKTEQGGRGVENGWFIAYNTENPTLLIAMMVEGVQDKGGSEHVVSKVKRVFQP